MGITTRNIVIQLTCTKEEHNDVALKKPLF